MSRVRVPIAGLMAIVVVLGIGMAALAAPSALWEAIVSGVTLMALLLSPLGWAMRRGRARAAFAGFAVCGWGYLLIGQIPWPSGFPNPARAADDLIRSACQRAHSRPSPSSGPIPPGLSPTEREKLRVDRIALRNAISKWDRLVMPPFVAVGHSLVALLFGGLGALLAAAFIAADGCSRDAATNGDRGP